MRLFEGLAVVVARHERKSGGLVGDSGRGSSAFAGAVDVILSIRRPEDNVRSTIREILALSRFDQTPDKLVSELTDDGYRALATAAVAEDEARGAILASVPSRASEGATLDGLLKIAGVGRTTGQKAVGALLEAGELRREGNGVKGDPYRHWRPTGPGESPDEPTPEDHQMRAAPTQPLGAAERNADGPTATAASGARKESEGDAPEPVADEDSAVESWYEQVQKVFEGKEPPERFDPSCPAVANVMWRRTKLVEKGRYRPWE